MFISLHATATAASNISTANHSGSVTCINVFYYRRNRCFLKRQFHRKRIAFVILWIGKINSRFYHFLQFHSVYRKISNYYFSRLQLQGFRLSAVYRIDTDHMLLRQISLLIHCDFLLSECSRNRDPAFRICPQGPVSFRFRIKVYIGVRNRLLFFIDHAEFFAGRCVLIQYRYVKLSRIAVSGCIGYGQHSGIGTCLIISIDCSGTVNGLSVPHIPGITFDSYIIVRFRSVQCKLPSFHHDHFLRYRRRRNGIFLISKTGHGIAFRMIAILIICLHLIGVDQSRCNILIRITAVFCSMDNRIITFQNRFPVNFITVKIFTFRRFPFQFQLEILL